MELLLEFLPSAGTIAFFVILLFLVQRLLERGTAAGEGHRFRNQLIMLALTAAGIVVLILVAPMGDARRGQMLSLLGILLSAAIALSSTTFLGNAMAGVMLRAVRNFRIGDFIRTGDHFGRVSERGLFHTEIQTEDRELTTLPNLYLVTHPVTTVRQSGTIVSAKVSLGYDVPRGRIEEVLLEAAAEAGLGEPFVHVMELGDFSVTYRVAGLLTEVKQLLSARSRLRGKVMDRLHAAGVEIVSPSFMNTRALAEGRVFIPTEAPSEPAEESPAPEQVVFDKADEAESLAALQQARSELVERMKQLEKGAEGQAAGEGSGDPQRELVELQSRAQQLEEQIASRQAEFEKKG